MHLQLSHPLAECVNELMDDAVKRPAQNTLQALPCCCRRDCADRESGAALRLAAAAAGGQGGDLGHLPRELAPDAAHVPAVCAGHPHPPGRDPGQQGALPWAFLATHDIRVILTRCATRHAQCGGGAVMDRKRIACFSVFFRTWDPKASTVTGSCLTPSSLLIATALWVAAGARAEQQCGRPAGGCEGHE